MGYLFTDLGAAGCCRSLNALFYFNFVMQDADVGVNDIEKMPYLDMCVQESLRLHPIGAMWVFLVIFTKWSRNKIADIFLCWDQS